MRSHTMDKASSSVVLASLVDARSTHTPAIPSFLPAGICWQLVCAAEFSCCKAVPSMRSRFNDRT